MMRLIKSTILPFFLLLINHSFCQTIEGFRFSKEIIEHWNKDTLSNHTLDTLILQAIDIQNFQLAQSIADWADDRKYPHFEDSPLQKQSIATFQAELLKTIKENRVVILNDVFPYRFSREILSNIAPTLKDLGVNHIGVDGLKEEKILNSPSSLNKDSIGFSLYDFSFLKMIKDIEKSTSVFTFDNNAFEAKNKQIKGLSYLHQYPNDKFFIVTHFDLEMKQHCYESSKLKAIRQSIPEAYLIDVYQDTCSTLSDEVGVYYADSISKDSLGVINQVVVLPRNSDDLFSSKLNNSEKFEIPKHRIIEYPVILLKYKQEDWLSGNLPLEILEVSSKEENAVFDIEKGKFTFVFIYTTRDLYHTLNVIKTK